MSTITGFIIELSITLLVTILVLVLLRSSLHRILVDLCGAEDRAKFWTVFTTTILILLPLFTGLGFSPTHEYATQPVFQIAKQLQENLVNFLWGLVLVGFVLMFFSASAGRFQDKDKK
jgi:uncharacterized membrane protein YhaH (DUF805 family)